VASLANVPISSRSCVSRERRGPLSDVIIGIGITAVASWVYWVGNTSLMFSHGDATWIHDMHTQSLASGELPGESLRDFRSGLGIWLAPTISVLDVPRLASIVLPERFTEVVFGAVSIAGLYFAGWLLSRQFSSSRSIAQLSGVLYAFTVFMPTPLMWTRVIYQSSFTWVLVATTVASAMLIHTFSKEGNHRKTLSRVGVILGLISAVGAWGLWVYPVAMFWCVLGLSIALSNSVPKRLRRGVAVMWLIGVLPLFWVFVSVTQLTRASASVTARDIAVGYVLDKDNPRVWFFDDVYPIIVPGTSVNMYGAVIFAFVLAGITSNLTSGSRRLRRLGRINLLSTVSLISYVVLYFVFQVRGREIGPSPGYLVLFQFPFWIVGIVTMLPRYLKGFRDRQSCEPAILPESDRSFADTSSWPRLTLVLGGLLVLWTLVWSVDNWHLRTGPRYFPVPVSETVNKLSVSLSSSRSVSFAGRVMIVQAPNSDRKGLANEILYPTPQTKRLRRELVQAGVPTLSTYSHLTSPQFMRAMSTWFAEKERFVRLWSVYESFDLDIARLLGVRFVLSERPLIARNGLTFVEHSDEGFLYEIADPNLGTFSPVRTKLVMSESRALDLVTRETFDVRQEVVVDRSLGDLTPVSESSFTASRGVIKVSIKTSGQSLVVLPVEHSSCMSIVSADGPARVLRVNYLLTGLLVSKSGFYVINVRNHPYLFDNCH